MTDTKMDDFPQTSPSAEAGSARQSSNLFSGGDATPNLTLTCPRDTKRPLTVFAKISIHPGSESHFKQWYDEISNIQERNWPGYLSSELLKPMVDSNEYISIFRYDSYEHLQAWMKSSQRQEMLQRAKEFAQAPPILSFHSLEYWFVHHEQEQQDAQDQAAAAAAFAKPPQPPPKYKMLWITFLVIWATNQWTSKVILRVFGKGTLPMVWFQAIATLFTVAVAVYIGVPMATALTGFWLFPHQPYTTSLRNGFMSLPWPVPKLMTLALTKCSRKGGTASDDTDEKDGDDHRQIKKIDMEDDNTAKTAVFRPGESSATIVSSV